MGELMSSIQSERAGQNVYNAVNNSWNRVYSNRYIYSVSCQTFPFSYYKDTKKGKVWQDTLYT